MTGPEALLVAEGLIKVFGSGRTLVRAVDGVDLHMSAREVVLVMGRQGRERRRF